jgi:hypothetical protein
MMISNIEINFFQINLMLELFMCWRLDLFELLLNIYSLGVTLFFSNFWSQCFSKFLNYLYIYLNLHYFLQKQFQKRIVNLRKLKWKKI